MRQLQQNSTAFPLYFLMVQSSDHGTPLTGAAPTVTLSKNGAAFGAAAGAVSEIGSGVYKVAGNATDTNTIGTLWLHATATSGDPTDIDYWVGPTDSNIIQVNGTGPPTLQSYPANFSSQVISSSGISSASLTLYNGSPTGVVGSSPSATSFPSTGSSLIATDREYAKSFLLFIAGSANAGVMLPILSYTGSTKTFTFASPGFATVPIVGDSFVIIGGQGGGGTISL